MQRDMKVLNLQKLKALNELQRQKEKLLKLMAEEYLPSQPLDDIEAMLELHYSTVSLIDRLLKLSSFPIDFIAWTTRNLLELDFLVTYVCACDDNLKVYRQSADLGEAQLTEGLFNLVPLPTASKQTWANHMSKTSEMRKLVAEINANRNRLPRLAHLSSIIGSETEYRTFHRLYSKFIHPTPWAMKKKLSAAMRINNCEKLYKIVLLKNSVKYADRISRELDRWFLRYEALDKRLPGHETKNRRRFRALREESFVVSQTK